MRCICQRLQLRVDQGGRELHSVLANVLHDATGLRIEFHRGVVPILNGLHLLHRAIGPRVNLVSCFPGETLIRAQVVRRVVGLVQAAHDRIVFVVRGVQRGGRLDCGDELHEALVHRALNHDSYSSFSDGRRRVLGGFGGRGTGVGARIRRRGGIVDLSRRCGVGRIGSRPTTARRSWIQARQDGGKLVSVSRLGSLEGLGRLFDIAVERCEALLLLADETILSLQQRNDRRAHGLEPALVGPIRGVLRVNEPPESLR